MILHNTHALYLNLSTLHTAMHIVTSDLSIFSDSNDRNLSKTRNLYTVYLNYYGCLRGERKIVDQKEETKN